MGYESDPLPSYPKLGNCSYPVKLIQYTSSSFIPQDHLPCLGPTNAPSGSSPAFYPPLCTMHIQAGRPPSPLWLSAAYLCILRWGGAPLSPLPPLPLDTPTLRLNHVFPSYPWSGMPLYGGMLSGPWVYPRSPPNSLFHRVALTAPPHCTFIPGPAPFLPSFLVPSISYPTTPVLSVGLG